MDAKLHYDLEEKEDRSFSHKSEGKSSMKEEELDEKKRKQNELYDQLVQQVFGSEQGP